MVVFWPGAFIFGFPGTMAPYWQEVFGVGQAQVGRTHFFLLAAVGTFMAVSGRSQEKVRPRNLVLFGSVLCGAGMFLPGIARCMSMIYLWAFLTGISASSILIPVLTIVQEWLPERRGLASGLVNLALGLSAAAVSPPIAYGIHSLGYLKATQLLGLFAILTGLVLFPFLRRPPWAFASASARASPYTKSRQPLALTQILRSGSFWSLWLVWGLAGAAGIATVILSTAFGLAKGLSMEKAVLILTAFNITNGVSRFITGYLSDVIGRRLTMGITFVLAGAAYGALPHVTGLAAWLTIAAVVGFSFGTVFAVSAPLIVDCFGMERFGTIFGMVFTAYAFVAGPLGPWLSGYLLDWTSGDFTLVFYYLAILCFLSGFLVRYVTPPTPLKPVLLL
jgi:OFA family oxalate/formate antiporter-like MFS transporter